MKNKIFLSKLGSLCKLAKIFWYEDYRWTESGIICILINVQNEIEEGRTETTNFDFSESFVCQFLIEGVLRKIRIVTNDVEFIN